MEAGSEFVGIGVGELAFAALHCFGANGDPHRGHSDEAGQANDLPPTHDSDCSDRYGTAAMDASMSLTEAASTTRTGDVFLFRGKSLADHAIRAVTNSPVNHVGMVLALEDLPPLIWHAELGSSIPDVWTGEHQRGTQLHRLTDAVSTWYHRYDQDAWMRPIEPDVTRAMEDEALRVVNELNGRTFPRTWSLAKGWLSGRARRKQDLEQLFCAEVVAITYERMGLLAAERPPNWYDPGKFWSGDRLELIGASLGPEVAIDAIPRL